ncbi:hypothetical protein [Brevundimonas sp.]|uniref:hypothetical protein n=1 Tax=Brevundimonas sp. TaxID=1871086 RepID=UPI00289F5536|nr:hypothetical protein [Brevundimonas sp.]
MKLQNILGGHALNDVFVAGGQPSITYVNRAHLGLERALKKALSQPNIIVSVTGSTKSGKTVLCRNVLSDREYIWIDGGEVRAEADLWSKVITELKAPLEFKDIERDDTGSNVGGGIEGQAGLLGTGAKFKLTAGGSQLRVSGVESVVKVDAMKTALDAMTSENITLVIDDFHYIPEQVRAEIIKAVKGSVFRGLPVVLLSTPHRAFDAIKAESEITGRFKHVAVPEWSEEDLAAIASTGFKALNATCPDKIVKAFAGESQGSPLLMQQFCWNACYDSEIERAEVRLQSVPPTFDTTSVYAEVARDAGLPTYENLAKGPQTRTDRIQRPLQNGKSVDIYQAILLAVAATGPKEKISYNEIRTSLNEILSDKVPQKLEVSNALKNLATKDEQDNRGNRAIDWDEDKLELVITDPFFRFYLRWEVAPQARPPGK